MSMIRVEIYRATLLSSGLHHSGHIRHANKLTLSFRDAYRHGQTELLGRIHNGMELIRIRNIKMTKRHFALFGVFKYFT